MHFYPKIYTNIREFYDDLEKLLLCLPNFAKNYVYMKVWLILETIIDLTG